MPATKFVICLFCAVAWDFFQTLLEQSPEERTALCRFFLKTLPGHPCTARVLRELALERDRHEQ